MNKLCTQLTVNKSRGWQSQVTKCLYRSNSSYLCNLVAIYDNEILKLACDCNCESSLIAIATEVMGGYLWRYIYTRFNYSNLLNRKKNILALISLLKVYSACIAIDGYYQSHECKGSHRFTRNEC